MEEIFQTLKQLMPELAPHLRRAARYILDRPHEVAMSSMRALAGKANVSPPTMLRLARRVGFNNYESFRAVFQGVVTGSNFRQKAVSLRKLGEHSGEAGVIRSMSDAATENIGRSFANQDSRDIVHAADMLRRAPTAYAFGVGAFHWMASYLQYLSRAVLPQLRVPKANGNSLVEGLVGVRKGDVILIMSASPYAMQTVKAAELARGAGAHVIGITDSLGSPLAPHCDILLIAGTESPQFYPSMVGIVAIIETLIALIVSKGDKETLARIATIDRLRRSEGGYFEL